MTTKTTEEKILILDFGSQYTQLIAREVREHHVYCEIVPHTVSMETLHEIRPKGLILSGGPSSVYAPGAPLPEKSLFGAGIPILGICYGLQIIGHLFGGVVGRAQRREYGLARFHIDDDRDLFADLGQAIEVWMSHGDQLLVLPAGFTRIGHTANAAIAAVANRHKKIYGIQFHPEVVHTPKGGKILKNFLFNVCGCSGQWTPQYFVDHAIQIIQDQIGEGRVICGISGGVDSAVAAALLHKAVGNRLIPIFVDNGLLRKNESDEVRESLKDLNIRFVDATDLFLKALRGVSDPEKKRKIIGREFIRVFEAEAKKLGRVDFLAQGTLYPDVIESRSTRGPSATIKSHHNVGGLPERMRLRLVEPLKELFKDEVRAVGRVLGLPANILDRHPFPGPGLAVRILGDITRERLDLLREADAIFIRGLIEADLYKSVWQALTVLLPVRTVGVMGDERTYDNAVVLRAVTSRDGMTADWARLPADFLAEISNRIINEVKGINRVAYDISSKPPSTIEWE
jgi:GMP synthase (glutamine-hydrolysing)